MSGANGGFMSKYATGIYSAKPADWSTYARSRKLGAARKAIEVRASYEGPALLGSNTVAPKKNGTLGAAVMRTPDGGRALAIAATDDRETLGALAQGDVFGLPVSVSRLDERRNVCVLGEQV